VSRSSGLSLSSTADTSGEGQHSSEDMNQQSLRHIEETACEDYTGEGKERMNN